MQSDAPLMAGQIEALNPKNACYSALEMDLKKVFVWRQGIEQGLKLLAEAAGNAWSEHGQSTGRAKLQLHAVSAEIQLQAQGLIDAGELTILLLKGMLGSGTVVMLRPSRSPSDEHQPLNLHPAQGFACRMPGEYGEATRSQKAETTQPQPKLSSRFGRRRAGLRLRLL